MSDDQSLQDPLFTEVRVTASIFVPTAELGDKWTLVMRGEVDALTHRMKEGNVITIAKVKASQTMHVDMDGVIDTANEQLMAQVTSFLDAAAYDEADEAEMHRPSPAPEIPGQNSAFPDATEFVDPETGEKLDLPDDISGLGTQDHVSDEDDGSGGEGA